MRETSMLFLQLPFSPHTADEDFDTTTPDFAKQFAASRVDRANVEPAYDYRHLLSPETRARLEASK